MDNNNMNNEQNNFYQDNTNVQATANTAAPAEKKTDVMAIISLVCGILAIILGCCTAYIGLIPGIAGIILAVLSKKNNGKSGMATAGMVCSIIGIVVAVLITIIGVVAGAAGLAMLESAGMY
jgi:thiol:disulfide interchange protein